MLQKNQLIDLTVTAMSAEGSGIGRAPDGMAVFVPFTAVGDTLRVRIVKVQKTMAFGIVDEIVTPSAHRIAADCPVFGKCGGCVYGHITYEEELRLKRQRVADAVERIGGLSLEAEPIIGCDSPWRYRNKAQYPVTQGENGVKIGFYAARSHRVVENRDCLLQPPCFETVIRTVEEWMNEYRIEPYDESTHRGLIRHVYLRIGQVSGEVMVCLVATSGKVPHTDTLVDRLKTAVPAVRSVCVNVNRRDTNVVLGDTTFALYGEPYVTDTLCGMQFRLSPQSFYQVNHDGAERLYRKAREEAALCGRETVLDLYCGTGTIGLSMADAAGTIIGVEVVEAAVRDAEENARQNGVTNARFIAADAGEAAAQLEREGVRPDVVVIDPPRKGCSPDVIDTIVRMAPDRVVYVSCDPATLARDLKLFAERGYITERVTPVDMFPRTAHVESVARLSKKG